MKISLKKRRILEVAANLAIVAVGFVIIGNLIWSRTRTKQNISAPPIGSRLTLSGVDWSGNARTVLMILQKDCVYCEASYPFYRKLYDKRKGGQPRMLAVIPGEQSDTERYLSDHGVRTDGVINASLSEVNVSATPTVVLVDHTGRVLEVWIGKLDASRQDDVTRKAFGNY